MKNLLVTTLEALGYPVYLQGTYSEDVYPDSMITFYITDSSDLTHYDNDTREWEWSIMVNFYSRDPVLLDTEPEKIRKALKSAGFIPSGKGRDLPSDDPTLNGWTTNYTYIER